MALARFEPSLLDGDSGEVAGEPASQCSVRGPERTTVQDLLVVSLL